MSIRKYMLFKLNRMRWLGLFLLVSVQFLVSDPALCVNVLIIGCDKDSGELYSGVDSKPFAPSGIATELDSILSNALAEPVNVTLIDRYNSSSTCIGVPSYSYNLVTWFYYPFPAGAETGRWANLRGESGTTWDYVVIIGDPYTMEYTPGMYAHGVAKVAEEVALGPAPAEVVLLMPWPGPGSSSDVDHYKEVVYRAGRTGGFKVACAGLAWQAAGEPTGGTHPSSDGAYIAAATIYSRIYGQSATNSTYNPHPSYANIAYSTVTNNIGKQQYSGQFSFQNPYKMQHDKRRHVNFGHRGTSTERRFASAVNRALGKCHVSTDGTSEFSECYDSNTPEDDGLGWPASKPMPIAWNHGRDGIRSENYKSYVLNTSYWQIGYGFFYQYNTWSYSIDEANDHFVGTIQRDDNELANVMLSQDSSARNVPVRTLWAGIHQIAPTNNPLADGVGPHLNAYESDAVGAYMYALYSGRCPVDSPPAFSDIGWRVYWIGYETAWHLGTCSTKAPGFKVMPTSTTDTNVTPSSSQTLSVYFVTAPTSEVTVAVATDDHLAGKASPSFLTFTTSNYQNPQTVTVLGETGVAGSYVFNVMLSSSSLDPAFDELEDSWSFMNTRSDGPVPPDIEISYGLNRIEPGSTILDSDLGTDYGIVTGFVSSVTNVYTIRNLSGVTTVDLTNSPRVTLTDPAGQFILAYDATTASLVPGGTNTFAIAFSPDTKGSHTATVSVASSDSELPIYSFQIGGETLGTVTIPFLERFESGTVSAGDLDGQNNWDSGGAVVQSVQVYEGSQALDLDLGRAIQRFEVNSNDVVWLDIYLMPHLFNSYTPPVPNDCPVSLYFNNAGQLVISDGGIWRTLTSHDPVNLDTWTRLTLSLNYSQQKWLVCLNGVLVDKDINFSIADDCFSQITIVGEKSHADRLNVSTNQPAKMSLDGDDIIDAWEQQIVDADLGDAITNVSQISDADDFDGDGYSSIHEYITGTDPTDSNSYENLILIISNNLPDISFQTMLTTSNYYGSLARYYSLERCEDMLATNWVSVPGYENIPASGGTMVYTNNEATNSRSFYRAKTWLGM